MADPAKMTLEETPTVLHDRWGSEIPLTVEQRERLCRDMNRMSTTMRDYERKGYSIVLRSEDMAEVAMRIEWLERLVRVQDRLLAKRDPDKADRVRECTAVLCVSPDDENDPYLALVDLAADGQMSSNVAVAIERYRIKKNDRIAELERQVRELGGA